MAKILLVEDDNNLREIYEARLQAEGYTIVSARDGEEALVIAKAEKPDLIISDIMMPKISGFEMLDILRNTEGMKHVKVIMLTALGQSDDQQRANKLGADRYLVKSQVTLEDIVKAAHDLLADGPTPAVVAEAAAKPPAAPTGPTPAPAPPPVAQMPVAEPPAEPPKAAPTPPPPSPSSPPMSRADIKAEVNTIVDDKLMNDAVNSLIADTEPKSDKPKDKKPVAKSIKISAASSSTEAASKPAQDDETPKDNTDADDEQRNVPIAHKKVIKPIENENKKDIATLLAEEEAKEAGTVLPSLDDTAADDTDDTQPDADKADEELIDAAKSDKAATSTAAEEASVDAKIEDFVAGATTEPTPPLAPKPATATPTAAPPPTPSAPTTPSAEPKKPSDPNIIAL